MNSTTLFRILTLGLLGFALTFSSCQQQEIDPCDGITCSNNGNCFDGTCNCYEGYSGPDCSNYDSCHNVTCYNGGVCVGGVCDCPPGYNGPDCGGIEYPVSMTINKITFNMYPRYKPNGDFWDRSSANDGVAPDPYPTFNLGRSGDHGSYVGTKLQDISNMPPLTYEGSANNLPYTVYNLDREHILSIWDHDGTLYNNNNDLMMGVYFEPETQSIGRPDSFSVEVSNQFWAIMHVTWND